MSIDGFVEYGVVVGVTVLIFLTQPTSLRCIVVYVHKMVHRCQIWWGMMYLHESFFFLNKLIIYIAAYLQLNICVQVGLSRKCVFEETIAIILCSGQ